MTHQAKSSESLMLDPWQIAWKLRAVTTLTVVAATMTSSLLAEDLDMSNSSSEFIGHFRVKQDQPSSVRMPGDFEVHQDLVLAVLAVGDSLEDFLETIAIIAKEVAGRTHVSVLLNNELDFGRAKKSIENAGCEMSNVSLVHATSDTRWIRDYGPTCVDNGTNSEWIDWLYDPDRPSDDEMPDTLLRQIGTVSKLVPLVIEGGNLLSNGQGIVVTSSEVFGENLQAYTKEDAVLEIAKTLNASDVVVLQPLAGEDTGHVDMFAAFVNAETVFVGYYREEDDPVNAAILDRNAAILAGVLTSSGNKLRVVRIPMDRNKDNVWRTYTNCIFANGVVLVPTYRSGSKQLARKAMELYEQHLRGWKVVAVDASELIECGGALRCASLGLFRTNQRLKSIGPEKTRLLPVSKQSNESGPARQLR